METPELQELAHIFCHLECQILAFVRDLVQDEAKREASSEKSVQLCLSLENARRALRPWECPSQQFAVWYLKDVEILPVWAVAAKAHRELFISTFERGDWQEREMTGSTARMLKILAAPLLGSLKLAASAGSLNFLMRSAIADKYKNLDEIVNVLHAQTNEPRDLPTW